VEGKVLWIKDTFWRRVYRAPCKANCCCKLPCRCHEMSIKTQGKLRCVQKNAFRWAFNVISTLWRLNNRVGIEKEISFNDSCASIIIYDGQCRKIVHLIATLNNVLILSVTFQIWKNFVVITFRCVDLLTQPEVGNPKWRLWGWTSHFWFGCTAFGLLSLSCWTLKSWMWLLKFRSYIIVS
jgi:hypothetical protein